MSHSSDLNRHHKPHSPEHLSHEPSTFKKRLHSIFTKTHHSVSSFELVTDATDTDDLSFVAADLPASSPKTENHGAKFLSTGFALIGYTFLLQLGLHMMTFALNGLAYRRLDTLSLGLVNVRIGLFYMTLMFISRDAFRRAFLSRGGELVADVTAKHTQPGPRAPRTDADRLFHHSAKHQDSHESNHSMAGIIDLAWTILPLGFIIAAVLLIIWIWVLPAPGPLAAMYRETKIPMDVLQRRYIRCLLVYAASGLFELSTEPFWLVCQLSHLVRERVCIEAAANAARALGIVGCIFFVHPDYAIYSVALPQILHGTTLLLAYLLFFYRNSQIGHQLLVVRRFRDLFPRTIDFAVDQRALKLTKSLFWQGLLKQLLTEGERYLISCFHLLSFTEQGIYDLVNNLGSTATRLLFLPMEESCHFVFNQCLNRNLPPNEQNPLLLSNVFRMFRTVLRSCSLIAWIGITFAQTNSRLLLLIYAGSTLANNPMAYGLLRLYAAYVLLLAWNGSTEAFLNAAMSPVEVAKHNRRLIAFSVVFLGANWLLVPWLGIYGFVVANSINMFCRIFYSALFINKFVHGTFIRHSDDSSGSTSHSDDTTSHFSLARLMLPSITEAVTLLSSLAITSASEYYFCCDFGIPATAFHAAITGSCLMLVLWIMSFVERDLIYVLQNEVLRAKSD